jgi:hypothetical protein
MHRLAKGEKIHEITDVRGTAFIINKHNKASKAKFVEVASNDVDTVHINNGTLTITIHQQIGF